MLLAKNASLKASPTSLGQFIACKGIAVTGALRKKKERAVYVSDDGECRLSSVTDKDNLKNMATLTTTTDHK